MKQKQTVKQSVKINIKLPPFKLVKKNKKRYIQVGKKKLEIKSNDYRRDDIIRVVKSLMDSLKEKFSVSHPIQYIRENVREPVTFRDDNILRYLALNQPRIFATQEHQPTPQRNRPVTGSPMIQAPMFPDFSPIGEATRGVGEGVAQHNRSEGELSQNRNETVQIRGHRGNQRNDLYNQQHNSTIIIEPMSSSSAPPPHNNPPATSPSAPAPSFQSSTSKGDVRPRGTYWTANERKRMDEAVEKFGRDYAKMTSIVKTRDAVQIESAYRRFGYNKRKEELEASRSVYHPADDELPNEPSISEQQNEDGEDEDDSDAVESQDGNGDEGLSNLQINKYLTKRLPDFVGVHAINQLSELSYNKPSISMVVNTKPFPQTGHWIAVKMLVQNGLPVMEVFDSLAKDMPKPLHNKLLALAKKWNPTSDLIQLKINKVLSQGATNHCGYFAMKFLLDRHKGQTFKQASGFDKFLHVLDNSITQEKKILTFKSKIKPFELV